MSKRTLTRPVLIAGNTVVYPKYVGAELTYAMAVIDRIEGEDVYGIGGPLPRADILICHKDPTRCLKAAKRLMDNRARYLNAVQLAGDTYHDQVIMTVSQANG